LEREDEMVKRCRAVLETRAVIQQGRCSRIDSRQWRRCGRYLVCRHGEEKLVMTVHFYGSHLYLFILL
jgi:hypothetical protein